MLLRRLQQSGHKPIVLMGGGTGKIGDPSFKDDARQLLSDGDIAANVRSIRRIFERFLVFGDGPTDAIMVDNAEWLDDLNYLSLLRDIGRHFSINRMLRFDSIRGKLGREQEVASERRHHGLMMGLDPIRTPVAAKPPGTWVAVLTLALAPPADAGGADPKTIGRLAMRRACRYSPQNMNPKINRKRSRHACRPPSGRQFESHRA